MTQLILRCNTEYMAKKKRRISHHFTTITPLSKTLAFILFIGLPLLGFFLGVKYGELRAVAEQQEDHMQMFMMQAQPTPSQTPYRQF